MKRLGNKMPFKSEKQRKWMHANEPEMAKDWEKKESLSENRAKLVKNLMQIYKDLDKKFKKYDHTQMSDWGMVTKHLIKKFGGNNRLASHISTSYNDYRGGEDIKKNITNLIKYSQKMTGKKLESVEESYDIYSEDGKWGYTMTGLVEAEYQGRKVKLGKPMQGDKKKFKVYVKNDKGNVVKVNFGQGGDAKGGTMKIRKSNPKARASFRARHNCDNPGPRHKARYWSCKKW